MKTFTRYTLLTTACALVLLGAGCSRQTSTPGEAALALTPTAGMEFTMRETAFGWAGTLVEALHQDAGRRAVTLSAWDVDHATIAWKKGEMSGTLRTDQDGDGLMLPVSWEANNDTSGRTGLWLSPEQYAALLAQQPTHVNLGLIDDSLAKGVATLSAINTVLKKLGQDPIAEVGFDPTLMQPRGTSTHTLLVDGEVTTVETVEAGNWMGKIVVLKNPVFPLVLAVHLNPAAYGPDAAISPIETLKGGSSYEIVSITTKAKTDR